jgi:hypothetical protein
MADLWKRCRNAFWEHVHGVGREVEQDSREDDPTTSSGREAITTEGAWFPLAPEQRSPAAGRAARGSSAPPTAEISPGKQSDEERLRASPMPSAIAPLRR